MKHDEKRISGNTQIHLAMLFTNYKIPISEAMYNALQKSSSNQRDHLKGQYPHSTYNRYCMAKSTFKGSIKLTNHKLIMD